MDDGTEPVARPHDLDRLAGEAYREGHLDRALGLLGIARMAYPARAELWDEREAKVREAMALRGPERKEAR